VKMPGSSADVASLEAAVKDGRLTREALEKNAWYLISTLARCYDYTVKQYTEVDVKLNETTEIPATSYFKRSHQNTFDYISSDVFAADNLSNADDDKTYGYLDFKLNVPADGEYTVAITYARAGGGWNNAFKVLVDGGDTASWSCPVVQTSSWKTFRTDNVGEVKLTKGEHVLRFQNNSGGINVLSMSLIPCDHVAGELIVDTAPTCTESGTGHKNCTKCGYLAEMDIVIPAKGHGKTEYIVEIPATAEKEGLAYNKCTVCGGKVGEDIILPKTGEASIGDKTFATLEEALDAATTGDVIKLNADVTVDYITVDPAVTLDLNGKNLTADYIIGFNGSTVCGEGKLIVDKDKVALDQTNGGYLPVHDGEGYIFIKVGFENRTALVGEKTYAFSPLFDAKAHDALLKHYAVSGVRVVVRLSWAKEGNYTATQDFTYLDSMVDTVIESYDGANYGEMFVAEFAGSEAGKATDVTVSAVIISDTGVEIASAITEFQIGN